MRGREEGKHKTKRKRERERDTQKDCVSEQCLPGEVFDFKVIAHPTRVNLAAAIHDPFSRSDLQPHPRVRSLGSRTEASLPCARRPTLSIAKRVCWDKGAMLSFFVPRTSEIRFGPKLGMRRGAVCRQSSRLHGKEITRIWSEVIVVGLTYSYVITKESTK